jgi:hypothetical protein
MAEPALPGEALARLVREVRAARDRAMENLELQEEVGIVIPEAVKREAEIMTSRPFRRGCNVLGK